MAEEVVITPDTEVKKDVKLEGTVDAITPEVAPKVEDKAPAPETVPLAVYLELKKDLKDLKEEIKESVGSTKKNVEIKGISDLASKYPDVSPEFMQDILNSATQEASRKIEEKYTPILEKQENEKKEIAFNKAFDDLFEKTLTDNPDLPKSIDKEAIKALAITPQYRNVPLADILNKLYNVSNTGKSSSENDARTGADVVQDIVSFDKITPEQKAAVMADPKTRQKYFDWLDTRTVR